jgi:hypothetical protein
MLLFADIFFDFLHVFVILFNLAGWMFAKTRKAHRWLVGATGLCWLVVGPVMMGTLGYCPLTDWHWRIKEARGAKNLPGSYIDYLLQLANIHADPNLIDTCVGAAFAAVVIATLWMWRRERVKAKAA